MRTLRIVFAIAFAISVRPACGADDLVKWRSIPDGEAESRKSGKPVLYFMTADWCGPCRMMKREVFSDARVAALINKTFVPVQVLDRSREEGQNAPEVRQLMGRFRVRGFPTLTVSRPGSTQGFQAAGWSSKTSTVAYLEMAKQKLLELQKTAGEVK